MRVAYVIDSLASGGAERMLLRQLQHSDREPNVYFFGGPTDLESAFESAGATAIDVGSLSTGNISTVWRLRNQLLRYDPDLVHAHLPTSHVVARAASRLAGIDSVISTHHNVADSQTYDSLAGKIERATRVFDDVDVAVSKSVRESHRTVFDRTRWEVVHNAVDVQKFHEAVEKADKDVFGNMSPVFLNVGRYITQKGQKELIEAMPAVLERLPEAVLVIVGWGELESNLVRLSEERGVENHVVITGMVPEIHQYYASADIFVFPSYWEGFGIVLLEAMASELPIIASNTTAIPEVVSPGFSQLVPPGSPEELSVAMVTMADSDTVRMGDLAFQHVSDRFHIDGLVEKYETLYRDIL